MLRNIHAENNNKNPNPQQTNQEQKEGLFLVNPTWVHLDTLKNQEIFGVPKNFCFSSKSEIKEKLEKGEKLFKVKVEEI